MTAWALFEALADEGVTVAYLDIDQVGMLYPATDDDPERYQLKAEALAALVPNYARAGAKVLIVSGVVDPSAPADVSVSYPGVNVTFCLLSVGDDVLRARILERGWDADEAAEENATLPDAPFVSSIVDTSGRSVSEVVAQVRSYLSFGDACAPVAGIDAVAEPLLSVVDLVVIYGPRAVGSSSVSFSLAMGRWRGGSSTGFVDLQQLAFLRVPGRDGHSDTALGIANVAAMHRLFAARGATRFIASAHLRGAEEHALLRRSVLSKVTAVRLHADAAAIEAHIRERVQGSDARLTGDDLLGASTSHQAAVLQTSLNEHEVLQAEAAQDVLVDVSGRPVGDVVSDLEQHLDGA